MRIVCRAFSPKFREQVFRSAPSSLDGAVSGRNSKVIFRCSEDEIHIRETAVDDEQCVGVFLPRFAKFKFFHEKMILSLLANKDEWCVAGFKVVWKRTVSITKLHTNKTQVNCTLWSKKYVRGRRKFQSRYFLGNYKERKGVVMWDLEGPI